MSLILDALNRSRQEAEPVPGVSTQHEVAAAPSRTYLLWLALAAALLIILWLLLDRESAEPAAVPATAVSALSDNVSNALTSVKTQLQSRAEQNAAHAVAAHEENTAGNSPDVTPSEPVAAAAVGPATARAGLAGNKATGSAQAPPRVAVPEPTARSTSKQDADIAALYRQQASRSAAAVTATPAPSQPEVDATGDEEDVDIEQILMSAREDMENARLVEHSAPFLATLSQATKDSIPTILYQRHDYSGVPGRSTVVLNSKKLHEGGAPAAGMKVQEILSDSVVLEYRGTVFRLRALNSWVNL